MAEDSGQRTAMARGMRPKAPLNIARDGTVGKRAVAVDNIPLHPNAVRQTKGTPAAFHHGITVDDLPNSAIISDREKPIGFSHGVTDAQIIKAVNNPTASQVLHDAANLGRGQKA